jgi:hypothetical protein
VDQQTKIFLTRKFREYYASSKLETPPEFRKREWAFVPFEVLPNFVMFRHTSFESEEELKAYVLGNVPAHVYYSSHGKIWTKHVVVKRRVVTPLVERQSTDPVQPDGMMTVKSTTELTL